MLTRKKEIRNDQGAVRCEKRKGTTFQLAVMEQARQVQENLAPEFPSLIKVMLVSYITTGSCLGLPRKFCDEHLPLEETTLILEDENGEEFEAKYLAAKSCLSAGWRGFSLAHKIREGDIAIFQLVNPTKFKVYIVRSNSSDVAAQVPSSTRYPSPFSSVSGTQQSPITPSYEKRRQRRLEENKKRMEELNLNNRTCSLKPTRPHLKPPPEPKQQVEQLRRSNRIANKPPPTDDSREDSHLRQQLQQALQEVNSLRQELRQVTADRDALARRIKSMKRKLKDVIRT